MVPAPGFVVVTATDPTAWLRSGWCWKCGPTRQPIAPASVSFLESCADHLPKPAPARQLDLFGREVA